MKFLADFLPVLLFFLAYKFYDIYVATAVMIVVAFLQVAFGYIKNRKFETMQLVVLALAAVFGGLTLILRDPDFVKWKPTILYWLFASVFLGSQWFFGKKSMVKRMMSHAISIPEPIWTRLNLMWVGFFISVGILNLYVAQNYSEADWVNFKLFGLTGVMLVFVVIQGIYLSRHVEEEAVEEESGTDNAVAKEKQD
jgi:intracellular septation protein